MKRTVHCNNVNLFKVQRKAVYHFKEIVKTLRLKSLFELCY